MPLNTGLIIMNMINNNNNHNNNNPNFKINKFNLDLTCFLNKVFWLNKKNK